MTTEYTVQEVIRRKVVSWESQTYTDFRTANRVRKEKQAKNCNPDVEYKVKMFQQSGATKAKTGVIR